MSDERRPDGEQRPRGGSKPRYTPASGSSRRDDRPRSSRDGDRKPYGQRDGERKPYEKRDGERKPYGQRDGDRKSYGQRDGDRKPYGQRDGDRKPYGQRDGDRKPFEKRDGERKPYGQRDGDRKPFEKRDGDRKPYGQRDGERRPYEKRDGERRPYEKRDGERRPYEKRDGERRPYEKRDGERRPYEKRDGERRASRPPQSSERREGRAPEIPDDVTARDLPGGARNELKTLSAENAEQVARHLVMAARLIDSDPALAHEHALGASRRAGRVAVVRETVGITAYAVGDFALALRELRTHRRISGSDEQIALIVDSERGVGRPDRALEAGRGVDRAALPTEVRVHLAIAMSGARLDLGESERALQELDIPELDPDRAFSWSPSLFAARAAVLEELGRLEEAAQWQRRADIAADALGAVDADLEVIEIDEVEELIIPDDDEDIDEAPGVDEVADAPTPEGDEPTAESAAEGDER